MKNHVEDKQRVPFLIIEKSIMDDENLKANDIMVYLTLKAYASWETGKCFPSIKTLCKKARMTDKTLKKSLDKLVELGYITIDKLKSENGTFDNNLYTLQDVNELNRRKSSDGPIGKTPNGTVGNSPSGPSEKLRTNYITNNYINNNYIDNEKESANAAAVFKEEEKKEEVKPKQVRKKKIEYTPEFEELWSLYPKKRNKPKCYSIYKNAIENKHHSHEVILYGIQKYAEEVISKNTDQMYIKHPEGFLNDERYLEYRRMDAVKKDKQQTEMSLF